MGVLALTLYNVCLFWGLISLAPLWGGYLLAVPKARAGFWEKLGFYNGGLRQKLAAQSSQRIWFHAVSVGEFNAIRPLVQALQGDYSVIISCTTRTGRDLAERTFPNLPILYFPYDLRAAVGKAMACVQPDLVVIAETELWPNFIDAVTRGAETPLLLINGRLSERSARSYHWIRFLIRPCLRQISHLYMQSQADADRMRRLGRLEPEKLTVAGNLKFDLLAQPDAAKQAVLRQLLGLRENDTVLTFASTHSGEDLPLVEAYLSLKRDFSELKLILAPRHPERLPEIKSILNGKALSYAVRSRLSPEHPAQQSIIVLDSIGELLTVYTLSRVAVMGGSFVEKGGQNPLESLSLGIPVIFGPYMHNFSEITRLVLDSGAGFQVNHPAELVNAVTGLLTQPEIYHAVSERGQSLVENNRGAKEIILKAIRQQVR